MILIFMFSAQPADDSSSLSRGLTRKILEWFEFFRNFDEETKLKVISDLQFAVRKTAHFVIYAILGCIAFLNGKCYEKIKKNILIWSCAFCLFYAITDEIHQKFVSGRSCELRDVFVDFCGSFSGIVITMLCYYLHHRIKSKKNMQ